MKILVVCLLAWAVMAAALQVEKAEEESGEYKPTESSDLETSTQNCDSGWTPINNGCFKYISTLMTWESAEKNCQTMEAHLASVQNFNEYQNIQKLILDASQSFKKTWIGGTNAQQGNIWLWSDGSNFHYTNWCPGEPNNYSGKQSCIQMNHSERKCWDDLECDTYLPSVCAQRNVLV